MDQEGSETMAKAKEAMYYDLNFIKKPEFAGRPGEDLEAFLKDFGRATLTLAPEKKCVAVKRSLVGDAGMYAKNYLKPALAVGDWKAVKAALRDRFLPSGRELAQRTELRGMVFNREASTLLGYVDRYKTLYKKVHPKADDMELISDASLNLGPEFIRQLGRMAPDWQRLKSFEAFRTIISRMEHDISASERSKGANALEIMRTVNKTVVAALEEPLKEIRSLLTMATKQSEPANQESVAAIDHFRRPRDNQRQPYKRKERDWERGRQQEYSPPPTNHRNQEPSPRVQELMRLYEQNFGQLRGTCFTCGGFHFKRHCPLENLNDLKE